MSRSLIWPVLALLVLSTAILAAGYQYRRSVDDRLLQNLCLVRCSTSMIGTPKPEKIAEARRVLRDRGLDLFPTYRRLLGTGAELDLAWLLITDASDEYFRFTTENVATVPWCEVRLWVVRSRDQTLAASTRDTLVQLYLSSPTAEGQLAAGRWHRLQGNRDKSEVSFYSAMNSGSFWDALDAADALLTSERFRDDAEAHMFSVVRDRKTYVRRAAESLLRQWGELDKHKELLDRCDQKAVPEESHRELVARIRELQAAPRTPL